MARDVEKKRIKLRAIVEYEANVPADWRPDLIDFHYNEGSWCASNFLSDVEAFENSRGEHSCLCDVVRIEYLGDVEADPTEVTLNIKFTPEAAERLMSPDE